MSDYNTGNPVPSLDPRDLDDNATVFDQLLMTATPSVPDRLGVARKTWWQLEQDAAAIVSPNITALGGLTGAADRLSYFTGVGAMALTTLTPVARTLLDDTTIPAMRATLGVLNVGVDYIDGLAMRWNSANSISILPGSAYIPSTGTVLTAAAIITKASLVLAATTKYHIYLFDNAGSADIEIVTTAPSAKYGGSGRTKTGDTTRRYLGSFFTAAANTIIRFKHAGNKVSYLADYLAAPFVILTAGVAVTNTNLSAAGCVPETATHANIYLNATHTNAIAAYINDGDMGAVSATNSFLSIGPARQVSFEASLSATQILNYIYVGTPTGGSLFVHVQGYLFER